jgi:regulator of sirC expression with transglutaminase-like and TPR domain
MSDRTAETIATLTEQGSRDDANLDLAECALLFASLDQPDADLAPFHDHLEALARDVGAANGTGNSIAGQAEALSDILANRHNYAGDTLTYDDPQNADLMRVIERRKGLPVTLAILYIHAARMQGWSATGINFPGHFLIRLEGGDGRMILDPFNGGIERDVSDLRALLKQMTGIEAELEPGHYAPIGNRQTLIRLLNNIKLRAVAAKENSRVADIVDRMLMIAPDDLGLLREAGQCHAAIGNMRRAIEALETVVARATNSPLRRETEALLRQVRSRLN